LRRTKEEKVAYVVKPQKVQQGWKRSSVEELRSSVISSMQKMWQKRMLCRGE